MKMTMKEYKERPEPGAHGLAMLMKNARKYYLSKKGVIDETTPEKQIGEVAHSCILEPDTCMNTFIVDDNIKESIIELSKMNPDDLIVIDVHNKNCKEFQEAKKMNPGKKIITSEEFNHLMAYMKIKDKIIISTENWNIAKSLVKKVMELENFKKYLDGGIKEETFFGEVEDVKIKCRPDLLYPITNIKDDQGNIPCLVFDVKSMFSEISGKDFAKASADNKYYMSEVLYRNVLSQNGYDVKGYYFVGISKVDWSGAEYFKHDQIALMEGEKLLRNALKKYKYCTKNNIWSEKQFDFHEGKFALITEVSLPTYVFYEYQLPEEL